tara:strand:+ start:858 stop:1751 length:894 start_codon:yes stop_codon:yes gene_type:complete
MIHEPLVSVVINCHNSDTYLREAIDSVINQTYQNWELLFWDNNSTDKSAEIAKSYDQVKYFFNKNTVPLGEARQKASEYCSGEYLAYLDCDDFWYSDKLYKQIEIITSEEDIGFVYGKTDVLIQDTGSMRNFGTRKSLPEGKIFPDLIKEDFIPFPSALIDIKKFRKIGGFPINFINSPDYWIFLHLSYAYKVKALQESCCVYRIHNENLSRKQVVIAAQESIELVKGFLPAPEAKVGLEHHKVTLSFGYLRTRNYLAFFNSLFDISWSILFSRITKKAYREVLFWKQHNKLKSLFL